jgi:anti-sigma regulatory factor (Ser/Thr protein kinase)
VASLVSDFDASGLYAVRAAVAAHASELGMDEDRLQRLLVVATELATNAIRHGGANNQLRLWRSDGAIYCQVTDDGPGISDPDDAGIRPVPLNADSGRGLWIVRQLSDRVIITNDTPGTTVTATLNV